MTRGGDDDRPSAMVAWLMAQLVFLEPPSRLRPSRCLRYLHPGRRDCFAGCWSGSTACWMLVGSRVKFDVLSSSPMHLLSPIIVCFFFFLFFFLLCSSLPRLTKYTCFSKIALLQLPHILRYLDNIAGSQRLKAVALVRVLAASQCMCDSEPPPLFRQSKLVSISSCRCKLHTHPRTHTTILTNPRN